MEDQKRDRDFFLLGTSLKNTSFLLEGNKIKEGAKSQSLTLKTAKAKR